MFAFLQQLYLLNEQITSTIPWFY